MFRASSSGPEEPLEDIPVVWVLGKLEEELIALRVAVREVRVPAPPPQSDDMSNVSPSSAVKKSWWVRPTAARSRASVRAGSTSSWD